MGGGSTNRLTADLVARAVVAAAMSYGDDPAVAMTSKAKKARRALTAAAGGLMMQKIAGSVDVAKALAIAPTSIFTARSRATADFLAAQLAASRAVSYACWRPQDFQGEGEAAAAAPAAPGAATPSSSVLPHSARRVKPPAETPRRRGSTRIKSVTARTMRYARRFLRARWDMEEVAWLFDVDAGDLQRRFKAEGGV